MSYHIGILVERLNEGGAERSAGLLSKILKDLGHQMEVIVLFDDVVYPYEGNLINLGRYKAGSRSMMSKLGRYQELHRSLKQKKLDLLLDFRMKNHPLRERLLNKFCFKTKMVNMVRSFQLDWYFPQPKSLSHQLYKNYAGISAVAEEITQEIRKLYGLENVSTIYNPIDIANIQELAQDEVDVKGEFILAVGRFAEIKQFDQLIKAYQQSGLSKKGISLFLLGDGPEKEHLSQQIKILGLEEWVRLIPFQENPFSWMKKAKFLVLSSKNEGFPRVLIEALACETPVISFNCSSGPSEIIQQEKNGLLVENQNFKALTEAMNRMVSDKELYTRCKENAVKSIEDFSVENISKNWKIYIEKLMAVDQDIKA